MGIEWEASHNKVPLFGVPTNPTEERFAKMSGNKYIYIYAYTYIYIYICAGGLYSQYFHMVRDKLITPIVLVIYPLIRIPYGFLSFRCDFNPQYRL